MTFIEINEPSPVFKSALAITVDGVVLDDEIKGFEVLKVRNREVSGNHIDTVSTNYGVMKLRKRMEVEPLEVEFIIRAESDDEYYQSFEELMRVLDSDDFVTVTFADEDAYYFCLLGQFQELEDNITNQTVGMFELFRETPFKYSDEKVTDGEIEDTKRQVQIFEIELNTDSPISGCEITNGSQTIRIIEPFNSDDEVVLDLRNGEAWKNGERFDYAIAIDSDYENFEVKGQDTITSVECDLVVRYRERWR